MKNKGIMRLPVLVALLAAILFAVCPAFASEDSRVDKLLELLQQKNVITADEAAELKKAVSEPAPAEKAAAERVAPAPKAPEVKVSGYMKTQAQFTKNGTAANADTFRVRTGTVTFTGEPAQDYGFKLQVDFARTDNILMDAYMTHKLTPGTTLFAGQCYLPISRDSNVSAADTDMLERPSFLENMGPQGFRDIGFKVNHSISPKMTVEAGMFNGNGRTLVDVNDQPMTVGRLMGKIKMNKALFEPEIGYLYAPSDTSTSSLTPAIERGLRGNNNATGFAPYDKAIKQWGLVAAFTSFNFKYEYMQGRYQTKNPALAPVVADGMYAQIIAPIADKLDGLLRYETYDPNLATTTASDIEWITLGLTLKAYKNLNYKLNYIWKKEAVTPDKNNVLGLEMLMKF